jgi:hypothetical protein
MQARTCTAPDLGVLAVAQEALAARPWAVPAAQAEARPPDHQSPAAARAARAVDRPAAHQSLAVREARRAGVHEVALPARRTFAEALYIYEARTAAAAAEAAPGA